MSHVDKIAFGQRVARRRKKLEMSQEELATASGMKQQGIANIEQGIVARPRLLREIAAALRTSEDWLLWKEGPEEVAPEPTSDLIHVRLISWVSAGKLAEPESQIPAEDAPLLAFADLGRGEFFALRVEGDSMDRISPDGSIIVINRADKTLVAEKAYVFWVRGHGATFKLWRPDPPHLAPHSWNSVNKSIFLKSRAKREFEVIGRVRRSLLDL